MGAWIAFGFGAALLIWAAVSIRGGAIWDSDEDFDGGWVRRREQPKTFWVLIALTVALALLAFTVGLVAASAH
jgi:hypothetical protein